MGFAKQERAALCDALEDAGADAPTLCEGWTAHDLAAHVWVRENDPSAAPGMFIGALADITEQRMRAVKQRWSFGELVQQIRRGPRPISVFAVPAVDEMANVGEFFVHTEDVRRPAGLPPREQTAEFEERIAKALPTIAKGLFRKAPVGVSLERVDADGTTQRVKVKPGSSMVTIVGAPSELLLFAFGRTRDARVELIGEPEAVERLRREHTGL